MKVPVVGAVTDVFHAASCVTQCVRALLALTLFIVTSTTASAITPAMSGTLNSADPSPIVWDGSNTYYQFTTGTQGVWYSTSPNITSWTAGGYVSPTGTNWVYPSWIEAYVPNWTVGNFWAPDVVKIGNTYYMYYAVSSFGTSTSAIGLATATSLSVMNWQDRGVVVYSNGAYNAINAIDPAFFQDATNGTMWLSYGSYFGGIAVIQIDPATMKVQSGANPIVIAGGNPVGADWEGSYITQNGGYYYLWANRGRCCAGVNSTYTIVVGRSSSITGSYLDQSGTALTAYGANGTFMWGNVDNKLSPGGSGVLTNNGCNYFSYFYYDANNGGNTFLDIFSLAYSGGWPTLTNNFTVGECGGSAAALPTNAPVNIVNQNSGKCLDMGGTANGSVLQQWDCANGTYSTQTNQEWEFESAPNSGYYYVGNFRTPSEFWNVAGNETASNTPMQLYQFYNGAANEEFEAVSLGNGYYKFVGLQSGLCLDVPSASTANGVQLQIYTCNGTGAQAFSFATPAAALPTNTPFNIFNQNSGLCLDAWEWGTSNGTIIDQWPCGNGSYSTQTNQEWEFQYAPTSGYYYIENVYAPYLYWNVTGYNPDSGAPMQLYQFISGAGNEEFAPVSMGNGYYEFVGLQSGLCLDTPNGSTAGGMQLRIWGCNGLSAQLFKLVTP